MSYFDVVQLKDADGNIVDVQTPLSVDGDSVYKKDIDTVNSDIGDFSGAITDLFDDIDSTISSDTDNPSLTIVFNRPIKSHTVTLSTSSGNFSNVTIVAKDGAGNTLETIDDSANNTDYTAWAYDFTSIDEFCHLDISFTTTDTVTLGFICIRKTNVVDAELIALKPDGTRTHINSTAGGNLKISLEEVDTSITDPSSSAFMIVQYEHHEIHEGDHFFIQNYADLAINNVIDIQFTTPNTTTWNHTTFNIDTETEFNWWIYEGVTINTPGTAVTPVNNNRNSSNTSGNTVASITNTSIANANADTAVAGATLLASGKSGSGKLSSGTAGRSNEIILKQNTIYTFRAEAVAAGYINYDLQWYEHADAN